MALSDFDCMIRSSSVPELQSSGDYILQNKLSVSHQNVFVDVIVTALSSDKDKLDVEALRELMYQFFEVLTTENDTFPDLNLIRE